MSDTRNWSFLDLSTDGQETFVRHEQITAVLRREGEENSIVMMKAGPSIYVPLSPSEIDAKLFQHHLDAAAWRESKKEQGPS